jgi:hypothetical protein
VFNEIAAIIIIKAAASYLFALAAAGSGVLEIAFPAQIVLYS